MPTPTERTAEWRKDNGDAYRKLREREVGRAKAKREALREYEVALSLNTERTSA